MNGKDLDCTVQLGVRVQVKAIMVNVIRLLDPHEGHKVFRETAQTVSRVSIDHVTTPNALL